MDWTFPAYPAASNTTLALMYMERLADLDSEVAAEHATQAGFGRDFRAN